MSFKDTNLKISQELMYYTGAQGDNSVFEKRASGAYIFRPNPSVALPIANSVEITTYKGDLFEEIHQVYDSWVTQVIRLYKDDPHVEFDWIVGPIWVIDMGKEIISRFTTELQTNNTFYTDSNGREMLKRIKDYRSDYQYTNEEPVAGNYYPVTSRITLKEDDRLLQLSILNDRAQGGTSLKPGEVELMMHRLCLFDDAFGVQESLQELEYGQGLVARGQHYLTLDSYSEAARVERDIAQRKLLAPWIFLGPSTADNLQKEVK